MDHLGSCCIGWWGIISQSVGIFHRIVLNFFELSPFLGDLTENNLCWDSGAHNEASVDNHSLPVASQGCQGLGWGGRGCALTGGGREMVEKMAIRFQCGVIGMPAKAHWRWVSFSIRIRRAEHHHSKRIWAVRAFCSVGRPCTRAASFRIVAGTWRVGTTTEILRAL